MHKSAMPLRWAAIALMCGLFSACSILGGPSPEQVKKMREQRAAREAAAQQQAQAATSEPQKKRELSQACADRLQSADKMLVKNPANGKVTHLKVSATGYGAAPKNYFPEAQRRLMTMRAAKVDAYRALAEVVGGLHVWGGSALSDMVLERDRYRSFVDAYVRGARVIAMDERKDGSFQASVEMQVDAKFLNQVLAFVDPSLADCIDEQDLVQSIEPAPGKVSSIYYSE